jgi:hypothetical protein
VAESSKPHQEVERDDVPREREQRMDRRQREEDRSCGNDWRGERDRCCNRALLRGAAVQPALDRTHVLNERMLDACAPSECAPLLEAERRQNRDQIHRFG